MDILHDMELKMYDVVADNHSEYKGKILAIAAPAGRTTQVCVFPPTLSSENLPAKGMWLDVSRLTLIEPSKNPPTYPPSVFNLEQLVVDKYTGFRGYVDEIVLYESGCYHYCVQSTELQKGVPIPIQVIPEHRLNAVPEPKPQPDHIPIPPGVPGKPRRGGPPSTAAGSSMRPA